MVIVTFGFQSTSSVHSQKRLPSSSPLVARMLTTTSKSVNSNCCGVSASRSLGPMSGSVSINVKILSMTSRSSLADSNVAPMAQEFPVVVVGAGFAGTGALGAAAFGAAGLGAIAATGFDAAATGFDAPAAG